MRPARVDRQMLAELNPGEKMLVWAETEEELEKLRLRVLRLGRGRYSVHRAVLMANHAYITINKKKKQKKGKKE